MKLYGYWRSSSAWRVRIALNLKGVAYQNQPVHLVKDGGEQLQPEFLRRNPLAQVPVLEFEHRGETRVLCQSMAIIEYLDERFADPPLLPANPYFKARARQLAEMVNAGIQPLQNLGVLNFVHEKLGGDRAQWARHWITRGLAALEAEVATSAGTYCLGDAVSLADLYLVPQLYNARRFGVDLAPYPILTRIDDTCGTLPAFVEAHPDQQPDAAV